MKNVNIGCVIWSVLAVLAIVYGTMVKSLNTGSSFFAMWYVIGIVFLALGVCAYFHLFKKIPNTLRIIIISVIAVCVAFFIFVEALVIGKFGEHGKPGLDYIIVLGAQVYEDGPSRVLEYRLDTAIEYLNDNPGTQCIVTGRKGRNEVISEARGMFDYMTQNGISPERIIMEDKAVNTYDNIRYSMELVADENASIGIVTSDFHMRRALMLAKKQNMKDYCGIASKSTLLYLPNNVFREFFGMVKDYIFS